MIGVSIARRCSTRMAVLSIMCLCVTIALAAPVAAKRPSYPYTRGGTSCSGDRSDPIGVVYRGTGALWGRVSWDIHQHTSWDDGASKGQSTYLRDDAAGNDVCHTSIHAQANEPDFSTADGRFHIRLFKVPHVSSTGIRWVVGTPHHEDNKICSHAVDQNGSNGSGFDWARRRLLRRTARGDDHHHVYHVWWGNTVDMRQCDGGWAGSNGRVGVITMGRAN